MKKILLQPLIAALLLLLLMVAIPERVTADAAVKRDAATLSGRPEYLFGVFPYLPSSRLEGVFAPLAAELAEGLEGLVHYRSAPDYNSFMARLGESRYDISFIQPFDYVRLAKPVGYKPLAKRREPLTAIFVVTQESEFQNLGDLKGSTIAMAPEVAALSYLGRIALLEAGLEEGENITIKYHRNHHSNLQQLLIGMTDVCVTGRPALRLFQKKTGARLRILTETRAIPSMLFVGHPRLSDNEVAAIRRVLLSTELVGVAPSLKTLLKKGEQNPFLPANVNEYEVVQKLWQALNESDR